MRVTRNRRLRNPTLRSATHSCATQGSVSSERRTFPQGNHPRSLKKSENNSEFRLTRKFVVPIIYPISSNLAADGRHQHAALVHAAARLGKHRHRGRQRDTKGRRRTASLNQPLLTQLRAAGRLGQAPQNPELGGLEKYGLRHALGCQEKKSPEQHAHRSASGMPSQEGHHAGALSEDATAMEPEPSGNLNLWSGF